MNKRLQEVYSLIEKYNKSYYTDNITLISDYEYDKLYRELLELEEEYPQEKKKDSPTTRVGGEVIQGFNKVEHQTPMLSLSNIFSYEELKEFDERVKKELNKPYSYVCELKIDGIAMSMVYQSGKFTQAITRGNGSIGEDVTHNVRTIKQLPKVLSENLDIEVRGEVYIDKRTFLKIQENEGIEYANPRNLVSGSIRQLDSNVTQKRNLKIFVYGLVNYELLNHTTYSESMNFLKEQGFMVNEKIRQFSSIEKVWKYIQEITELRSTLDYEIDGVVIKVNEYENQLILGQTSKYPKWSAAYKFTSSRAKTKIKDIIFTVGRTGKVIPNAVLEPVFLMGSTISRATLHNYDYVKDKDIRIGDTVIIIKAGDIIPRVEEVDLKQRASSAKELVYPEVCPECGTKLVIKDKDYICLNPNCPGKNVEKLIYFVSKTGFNIDGLGEKIIEKLYEKMIINDFVDIFDLDFDKLHLLEGFQEKSIANILNSIEKSKTINLENFLTALGINSVGLETSKLLANKFETIEQIEKTTSEEFESITGIGPIIASDLYNFFNEQNNIEKIDYLIGKGIKISNRLFNKKIEDSKYLNKRIVITGSFLEYTRSEIKKNFEDIGARVTTVVSKNTDYLILGEDPGSKYDKAISLNVEIIDANKLKKIFNEEIK